LPNSRQESPSLRSGTKAVPPPIVERRGREEVALTAPPLRSLQPSANGGAAAVAGDKQVLSPMVHVSLGLSGSWEEIPTPGTQVTFPLDSSDFMCVDR
jgi:hypothetical protein